MKDGDISQESQPTPPQDDDAIRAQRRAEVLAWKAIVARYQTPNIWRATWQILNTIGSYVVVWYLIYLSLKVSWWLVVPLAILAGGLLVRIFIIFHDCGHGSFFKSRIANDILGFISGVLTWTPYYHWRAEHAIHHGTAQDLDRRGAGDIWTLTVTEYLESSRWKKLTYRMARNPIVIFVIAPMVLFAVWQRFPSSKANAQERRSVWTMDLAILLMVIGMSAIYGFVPYLVIQLIAMAVAGSAGVWLFYVQHQFEDVYWERGEDWDYTLAAMKGSSFYKLPKVLQWFSGNIGFHHVHHLSPRIPNYNLQKCHQSDPMFQTVKPVTLLSSLKSLSYRLWDESAKKLVGYRHLKSLRKKRKRGTAKAGGEAAISVEAVSDAAMSEEGTASRAPLREEGEKK